MEWGNPAAVSRTHFSVFLFSLSCRRLKSVSAGTSRTLPRTTLTVSPYNKWTAVGEPRGGLEDEPSVRPLWEDRLPDGESQLPGQGEHFELETRWNAEPLRCFHSQHKSSIWRTSQFKLGADQKVCEVAGKAGGWKWRENTKSPKRPEKRTGS